jgi:ubiquinone/menaquinone biosynthesis C-methylase UbiE
MQSFNDSFSKQSDIYLKYRPSYPTELFSYLSSLTEKHALAWDCGTGNGQAAISLSAFYEKVLATEPSESQIRYAMKSPKVSYFIEAAESSSIRTNTVDIVTIANALHWFNFDLFYKEVNRIVKSNGVIAAWSYGLPEISPEIDSIVKQFHDGTLGTYWQPQNRLVEKQYATIPFPFQPIPSPKFYIEKVFNLKELIGYFNTWSATQRFINDNKFNPTEELEEDLNKVWTNTESKKKLRWELILKVGKVNV